MKNILISMRQILVLIAALVVFYACTDAKNESSLIIHEIYKVEGDENTKKPTVLSYKDVKQYDEVGQLVQRNFYNVDNTLKGYEFIKRNGSTGVTNYYDVDSNLLAIYNLTYESNNNVSSRMAYDGTTKELLRSENYKYDTSGSMKSKAIYNSKGELMDYYEMKYDAQANEVEISRYSNTNDLLHKELFVIAKQQADGKWTERWGYINGQPHSFHRRTFSNN